MKLIRDILTDYDGSTYDTGRVLAVVIVLAMLAFEAWVLWRGAAFDAGTFGGGIAAVLAALGAAIFGDNHKRP